MAKKDRVKFIVKGSKYPDFIDKLSDLTDIGNVVKLKIDRDNILMYSLVGETAVLAFKSYLLNTSDYFEFEDFDYTLDYVINDAKKFVKNFNFLNVSNTIEFDIAYKDAPESDEIKHVRAIMGTDSRLKLSAVGAEQYKIRDMSKDRLAKTLDITNSKWSFSVHKDDFTDIKKLSSINDDKILTINIVDNKVKFSEMGKWELDVATVDSDRYNNLVFGKKYLKSVNLNEDYVNFNVFEQFILIKDNESNFMMSFEQSFDDDPA